MSQRLKMPFSGQMALCGYKNAKYQQHWGYAHYGMDLSSIQGGAGKDPTVLASGEGEVLAAGKDTRLGYGLAVLYRGAYNHKTGQTVDVVARYMHLRSIAVGLGDRVQPGTALGVEGKEGTTDYHLHLEFDTDTTPAYATWSPQVAGTGGFWKKGTDTTLDPAYLLHVGSGQTMAKPTYNPEWLNPDDLTIPALPQEDTQPPDGEGDAALKQLQQQLALLQQQLQEAQQQLSALQEKLEKIRALCTL